MCTDVLETILLDVHKWRLQWNAVSIDMAQQGMRPQRVAPPVKYSSKGARNLDFSK